MCCLTIRVLSLCKLRVRFVRWYVNVLWLGVITEDYVVCAAILVFSYTPTNCYSDMFRHSTKYLSCCIGSVFLVTSLCDIFARNNHEPNHVRRAVSRF